MVRFAALVALALPVLAAPPAAGPPTESFAEAIDVDVVEVEVHVADADGRPVTGLAAGDFRVRVDGREVTVVGVRAEARGEETSASAPTTATDGDPAASPLHLVLWIADARLLPRDRERALDAAATALLPRLGPATRTTVLRYENAVSVVLPWSAEPAAVARALAAMRRRPARLGEVLRGEQRALAYVDDLYQLEQCRFQREMRLQANRHVLEAQADVLGVLAALRRTVRALAPLPGRKVLVLLADRLPLRPGQRVQDRVEELCPNAPARPGPVPHQNSVQPALLGAEAVPELVGRIAREASAAAVTIHALQPAGSSHHFFGASATQEAPVGTRSTLGARADAHDSLVALATDTGGRAFLERGDLEAAFAETARDLAVYYSLALDGTSLAPGELHRVEVEVGVPGAAVRHRPYLRTRIARARTRDEVLAALAGVAGGELGARVEVGRVAAVGDARYEVSLWLRLPLAAVVFLPEGEERVATLSLHAAAVDGRGRETPVQAVVVPVRLAAGDVAGRLDGDFLYELKTVMRPGRHTVALRVEDVQGGGVETLDVEVTVPPEG